MLDAAACCQTRLAAEPATSLSALTALRILLLEAMRTAAAEEPSDAGIASPDSYRGDRHAAPSSPAPTAAPSTRSLVGESAAGIGGSTEMERVAGSDAADVGLPADPSADGAPRRRRPGVLSAFAPSGGWGTLPAHCGDWNGTGCSVCGSAAISERPERTTQGYRRYRCGTCGKQFNERSVGVLNRAQYPSDVIALVVFWRLRYKLSLRDLAEMFLTRGFIFSYEAVRDWEAKLTPALAEHLRRRRKGRIGPSWYIDTRRISGCGADGGICIGRLIATAL